MKSFHQSFIGAFTNTSAQSNAPLPENHLIIKQNILGKINGQTLPL
jgi:hypothetical protein